MNIDDFKARAINKHGNKYDYSLIEIINNKIPVDIICNKHGVFSQNIYKHLNGQGCRKCMYDNKRISKEDFIKRSNLIHKNKYGYGQVDYKNNSTNVDIKCPLHGLFKQTPSKHLQGHGCEYCGGSKKMNTSTFIDRANTIHNNRYKYNNSVYKNSKEKICIKCDKHGDFYQNPMNHLKGHGCPSCSNLKKLNTKDFIERSNKIHNNKYNYDNVNYVNHKSKVSIRCNKHGYFEQIAGDHLTGRGCPSCRKSKGELKIESFLIKNNINYKSQYIFNNLKHRGNLKFDFGLIDHEDNLVCLVEFNGEQHYNFNSNFHKTIDGFEVSKYRDFLKFDYCTINKIPLIIIRYDDNIDEIMTSILNKFFKK